MSTYCLKCKHKTDDKNVQTHLENNRVRETSECVNCDTKKSKFVPRQKGGGDLEQKLSSEAYKDNSADNVDGYVLDKELSNRKTKVYSHPETKHTVVAHRGTKDKSDLLNDVKIVLGKYDKSKRVENATAIADKAKAKYGDNITNTGHSLGGTTASIVAGKTNSKVETYNKGASPLENYKQTTKKAEHNITGVDPISVSTLLKNPGSVKLKLPTKLNVHGLANFAKKK